MTKKSLLYAAYTIQNIPRKKFKQWKRKCEFMGVRTRTKHLYALSFADDKEINEQEEEDLSFMVRKREE